MDERNLGQRIISALQELEQFRPAPRAEEAVNVMNGARLTALRDDAASGHGSLLATFPGGKPVEVIGELYLQLQVIESVRLERDGAQGKGEVSRRVQELSAHLRQKHGLDR